MGQTLDMAGEMDTRNYRKIHLRCKQRVKATHTITPGVMAVHRCKTKTDWEHWTRLPSTHKSHGHLLQNWKEIHRWILCDVSLLAAMMLGYGLTSGDVVGGLWSRRLKRPLWTRLYNGGHWCLWETLVVLINLPVARLSHLFSYLCTLAIQSVHSALHQPMLPSLSRNRVSTEEMMAWYES